MRTAADACDQLKDIISELTNKPSLSTEVLYNAAAVQADWVSCTAYVGLFMKKLAASLVVRKESTELFMQRVANGEETPICAVRAQVSDLGSVNLLSPSWTTIGAVGTAVATSTLIVSVASRFLDCSKEHPEPGYFESFFSQPPPSFEECFFGRK